MQIARINKLMKRVNKGGQRQVVAEELSEMNAPVPLEQLTDEVELAKAHGTRMYLKTEKLRAAKFRGQRALVVEALTSCSNPVTLEALAQIVDRNGQYSALLNQWAKDNGGVKGSVRYHLRALKRLGMVEETRSPASMRTQIVGWGNSQAIRIPRAVLDALKINEGDEVEMRVENGKLTVHPVNPKVTLESLVAAITPENRHGEIDWGKPVGNEVW